MDLFILNNTPGVDKERDPRVMAWTDICHRKQGFVFVKHDTLRQTSRWVSAPRKKPFAVVLWPGWSEVSWHKTLRAAIAAAEKIAKER